MSAADFTVHMNNHDRQAVEIARRIGPSAVPALRPLLADRDELKRLLAVDGIVAAGGPEAPDLLIARLDDASEQVRINAVNGLHERLPVGRHTRLFEVWRASKDEYIRQQIPLVLGRLEDDPVTPLLVRRRQEVGPTGNQLEWDRVTAGLAKVGEE